MYGAQKTHESFKRDTKNVGCVHCLNFLPRTIRPFKGKRPTKVYLLTYLINYIILSALIATITKSTQTTAAQRFVRQHQQPKMCAQNVELNEMNTSERARGMAASNAGNKNKKKIR